MPTVKIVLIDDHDLVREGARDFLESLPRYEVVGEASTARAGLEIIERTKPDIVLMDIGLPGMDGVIATREILRRVPRTRVVLLTAHKHACDVIDGINAGAVGFVLKGDPLETLMQALDHATRGFSYVAPALAADPSSFNGGVLGVLSGREREVFRLAAACRTAPEIARELRLARKTVDTHLSSINRKLGLHDRADLVRLAAGIRLVHSTQGPAPASV